VSGTHAGTPGTYTPRPRARLSPFISFEKKSVMEDNPTPPQATQTIRCTPENLAEFRQTVKGWRELHQIVDELIANDLFGGLRGVQITLTGDKSTVDKGLAGVREITAQKPV
jgi:hypothetical protein